MTTRPASQLRQPRNPREAVVTRIERQDSLDAVLLHHGQVHRVACGEPLVAKDDLFGALDNGPVDRKDFIHHVQQCVKGRLYSIRTMYGYMTVQDFLQDFRVSHQAFTLAE